MAESGRSLQSPALVKVTTAGTAVRLAGVETDAAKSVIVQALGTNTEPVVVGASTVKAAAATIRGVELAAKQTISFDITDSAEIWVDSRVNGEGVSYVILVS